MGGRGAWLACTHTAASEPRVEPLRHAPALPVAASQPPAPLVEVDSGVVRGLERCLRVHPTRYGCARVGPRAVYTRDRPLVHGTLSSDMACRVRAREVRMAIASLECRGHHLHRAYTRHAPEEASPPSFGGEVGSRVAHTRVSAGLGFACVAPTPTRFRQRSGRVALPP